MTIDHAISLLIQAHKVGEPTLANAIKQIQLDAWKQGMTDAAREATKCQMDRQTKLAIIATIEIKRDNTTSLP